MAAQIELGADNLEATADRKLRTFDHPLRRLMAGGLGQIGNRHEHGEFRNPHAKAVAIQISDRGQNVDLANAGLGERAA